MELFERVLILDTSGRVGRVALAEADRIVTFRVLSEARRHARDLPLRICEMLGEQRWSPNQIKSIIACVGPGSYTGLRVGIASAKAFAYATGCAMFAVPTFDAIAISVPPGDFDLAIVADAQQGNLYTGRYQWTSTTGWNHPDPIAILSVREWINGLKRGTRVTGPGLGLVRDSLSTETIFLESGYETTAEGILETASKRSESYRSNPWTIEPIYLRGSSAEEKRKRAHEAPAPVRL